MSFTETKRIYRAKGVNIKKIEGEYQVNYIGGKEATKYFTDSLEDALNTADIYIRDFCIYFK